MLTTKQVKKLRDKLAYYVPNLPPKTTGDREARSGYLLDQLDILISNYIELKKERNENYKITRATHSRKIFSQTKDK